MTNKQHQVKPAKPAAVELNDASLDRAAGGAQQRYADVPPAGRVATIKGTLTLIAD